MDAYKIVLIYYMGINLLAFCLYGIDKQKAKLGKWRISERTLIGTALLGGALGAWLGMQVFRHKTKHWKFKILVPLCLVLHVILMIAILNPFQSYAANANTQILQPDVTTPSDGCVFVGVEGSYIVEAKKALKRINEIRLEACKQGVPDPSNPKRALTVQDYVPIQWSSDLEYVARIRAAEASIVLSHTRPNGKSCFSLESANGISGSAEVLAWNSSDSMVNGVNQWYSEKSDWVKKNRNAVTGHYTSMIDPDNTYVGLATFCSEYGIYYNTTCGRFSSASELDSGVMSALSDCVQLIEIKQSALSKPELTERTDTQEWKIGDRTTYTFTLTSSLEGNTCKVQVAGVVLWNSSNPEVATVDAYGEVKITGYGTTVITAVSDTGVSASETITVKVKPKKTSISKVTAGRKKITVKWKKQTKNADGYQIQCSAKKNFKSGVKTKTVKGKNKTSTTVTGLKAKKQYYVRVRTYQTVNGKTYYSTWSKAKTCKTK